MLCDFRCEEFFKPTAHPFTAHEPYEFLFMQKVDVVSHELRTDGSHFPTDLRSR